MNTEEFMKRLAAIIEGTIGSTLLVADECGVNRNGAINCLWQSLYFRWRNNDFEEYEVKKGELVKVDGKQDRYRHQRAAGDGSER